MGGDPKTNDSSDQVFVLDSEKNTWAQLFPAMPTARGYPSAIGYKKWLVVAGGAMNLNFHNMFDVVELLDTSSKQWYKATLPTLIVRPSLAIIDDTLYIAWQNILERTTGAHHIFIPKLISGAISPAQTSSCTEWKALPDPLTKFPALVSLPGQLLAVGGCNNAPSSTIAMYLPYLQQWQKVAEFRTPRLNCVCCYVPATKELIVFGGSKGEDDKESLFIMEICELDTTAIAP